MRTLLVIALGLAILAVAFAPKTKPKNKTRNIPSSPKSKKEPPSIDIDIDEDIQDILHGDNDDDDDVEIPSANQLSLTSDPIGLARRIKSLTDSDKKKELTTKLKKLWNQNKDTLAGRFYQAAYAALLDEKRASRFWTKQLENATKNVQPNQRPDQGFGLGPFTNNNFLGSAKSGIDNFVGNAQKVAQADPVGMAMRRGESFLLGAASEGAKGLGKLSDFTYDTVGNISNFIKAATPIADMIPIVKDIKKSVHDFVDDKVRRGKYISGTLSDISSEAFANAAKDAASQADEREKMFRQVSMGRTLF